ncbi:Clp amino terminal domain-containing protein, pathogenicity island component [Raineyella antarctica]|uniref:Clp amino terminal domain-containing protein, pathogenicity island component n=1 Tax=Raineyella antarctica TaxID=1577474 RepID=A0A1G6GE00_9ACTN|nr:Clp protease N-terminal domain-containing protein [Raineyella antarctica]SDB80194.1 Clp amino terminal domain-containing protein, pathogenicity island component [Raineyella antarctica]
MFDTFTEEAFRMVVVSTAVAADTGWPDTVPGHLLVTLAEEAPGVRAALRAAGAVPDYLAAGRRTDLVGAARRIDGKQRRRREARALPSPLMPVAFDPAMSATIQMAVREALRLGDRSIASRHLMLALLRVAADERAVLVRAGTDLDRLRAALAEPWGAEPRRSDA